MKRQKHPSRELVLKAIRNHPETTVNKIAAITGLTENAIRNHVSQLVIDDLIYPVRLAQKPGRLRTAMLAYRPGKNPAPVAKREATAPQQWEVLARFFGRIAEPAAA